MAKKEIKFIKTEITDLLSFFQAVLNQLHTTKQLTEIKKKKVMMKHNEAWMQHIQWTHWEFLQDSQWVKWPQSGFKSTCCEARSFSTTPHLLFIELA